MKNILIIGASGDIGIAIAEELANENYCLILQYNKHFKPIQELKKRINSELILSSIQADLYTDNGVDQLLEQLFFQIDGIVFAGGTAYYGLFQDTSDLVINQLMSLHIKAPLRISKALLPNMIKRRLGHIILISSIWGHVGASHEVIYSTVKGAQNSFVKSLAKEVSSCNISVNGVSPGFIDTKMNMNMSSVEKEDFISKIPINRAGLPTDIAHVVNFLLDNRSQYIQGEMIKVTGGL